MIQLTDITKTYGPLTVLHSVSLSIPRGKITAIIGPSGAGKTTLLQILGTLDRPDSGTVTYDGTDVTRLNDKALSDFRCRNIGFVFQFHRLLPEFTALENAALPAVIAGSRRKDAYAEGRRLLEALDMGHRLNHRPAELSGGERQRVAVARALVNKPMVILADEPTGSLDSRNRAEIESLFMRLRDDFGHTLVIVTHDTSMASIADTVITLADGRVVSVTDKETTDTY